VPSTASKTMHAMAMTAQSLDGLRRAGWAKYYAECQKVQTMTRVCDAWMVRCAEMAVRLSYHSELRSDDPAVEMAKRIIGTLRLHPRGQIALRAALDKVRAERADNDAQVAG